MDLSSFTTFSQGTGFLLMTVYSPIFRGPRSVLVCQLVQKQRSKLLAHTLLSSYFSFSIHVFFLFSESTLILLFSSSLYPYLLLPLFSHFYWSSSFILWIVIFWILSIYIVFTDCVCLRKSIDCKCERLTWSVMGWQPF